METPDRPPEVMTTFVFGPFRFNARERTLLRAGAHIRLTPKTADLLAALLQDAGRVVTKEELLQRLWPDTFVVDGSLTFYVHQLRKALADATKRPTYVETVAGRGYRFVCPVTIAPDSARNAEASIQHPQSEGSPVLCEPPALPRHWPQGLIVATAFVAVVAVTAARIDYREPAMPRVVRVTQLTHDGKAKTPGFFVDRLLLRYRIGDSKQYVLHLDTGGIVRDERLDAYRLLDVSSISSEALALRPQDRGAENALWAVRLDGSSPRRVGMTTVDGYAAWSHDGRRIAYGRGNTVYVTDSDGGLIRSLSSFTGSPQVIRWAPDDRYIRVDVHEKMDRTAKLVQYDVRLLDGVSTRLAVAGDSQTCCGIWILPDEYAFVQDPATSGDIWMRHVSSGYFWRRPPILRVLMPPARLARFTSLAPSPDGSRLYGIGQAPEELATYDTSRGVFVPYLNGISAFSVSFSRDRRFVAYIALPDYTLWRANADGRAPRQLTFAPWHVDALSWSPDGRRFAMRAKERDDRHAKIYLLPADGGPAEPLEKTDVEQGSPTWSPDGVRLAFGDVPETYGQATGSECLHIYDLATRTSTDIPGSEGLWSSRWSPDGRYIAATRISDRSLMLYDTVYKYWKELNLQHVAELTWSLEGMAIFAEPERPAHWVVSVHVPDGRVERLVDVSDEALHFGGGVALDGRPLLLRFPTDIYALQLERE